MITTLLLAVLIAGVIIVPTFIPGLLSGNSSTAEGGSSANGSSTESTDHLDTLGICVNTNEIQDMDVLLSMVPANWQTYTSAADLESAVETEAVQGGFILNSGSDVTYVVNNLSMMDSNADAFQSALSQYHRISYLSAHGLTGEEISALDSLTVNLESQVLGKNSARNYLYTYILVFVIYFLILFYGQMIAVSVTTEKSNRAIEILVTSVNPNSLIFGKVLAGAIAGVLQAVVILGAGFLSYNLFKTSWGGVLDFLFDIPARVLIAYMIFGTLSYLLYAFIFGMLGAMVSKTEDISKSSTPVTLIYVASFLVAMFGMANSDSLMMKVCSFIPFTSGNAMFIRISMGEVALWEILLSFGLLLLSCIVAGMLAAKLFRFGTLHYGNPIKFRKALKQLKD